VIEDITSVCGLPAACVPTMGKASETSMEITTDKVTTSRSQFLSKRVGFMLLESPCLWKDADIQLFLVVHSITNILETN